ncbi:MAG: PEP-CTERM sorting domain-containing protein [Planctomycetaceae bacterium]|nr:PEP-CTERM sorting domain-containing protein [Planctomycetaceae bacterium]
MKLSRYLRDFARSAGLLLCGTSAFVLSPMAWGQEQVGRTQASGLWSDGNWSNLNGGFSPPGAADTAYIGSFDGTFGWSADASVNLDSDAQVSGVILGDGTSYGILTIDAGAKLVTGSMFIQSGSGLNVNGALEFSNALYVGGGTINQNGDMFGSTLNLGWANEAATFHRTGGILYLADSLNLQHGSNFTLTSLDTLTTANVYSGSTLTIDSKPVMTNLYLNSNSTLVLNDNIETWNLSLDNATLTRNNGATFSTENLSVTGMNYDLNGTDAISGSVTITGGSLTVSTPTYVPGSIRAFQSTVDLNALTSTSFLQLSDSTTNIEGTLDFTGGTLSTDGGTINQNADIVGGAMNLGTGTGGTVLNRMSGSIAVTDLSLSASSLTLSAGDSAETISIYSGSNLTVNDAMQIGGLTVGESTLVLNDTLTMSNYASLYDATVIRNNGAGLVTSDLSASSMDFELGGADMVSNSITFGTGTLVVSAATTIAGNLGASQAVVNLNADFSAFNVTLGDTTLNVNANLQAVNVMVNGGEVFQNGNISGSNLWLGFAGDATGFQRVSGTVSVNQLTVGGGSSLNLTGDDSMLNLVLFDDSLVTFQQLNGQMTGLDLDLLSINSAANLHVLFGNVSGDGLDWGLRLSGNQGMLLTEMLNDGRLTSDWIEAAIVYDTNAYGNYTYFGAVTAVPEPSSLVLIAGCFSFAALRRRRAGVC